MADLRSILWHFRKKIVFGVLICCIVYAIYALQHCCTQTSKRTNSSGNSKKLPSFSNTKSGNISGNRRPSLDPFVVGDRGKLTSRTLVAIKEGSVNSTQTAKFDVFRNNYDNSKNLGVFQSDSESSSSSDTFEDISSSVDDTVEHYNTYNKPVFNKELTLDSHEKTSLRAPMKNNQPRNLSKKLPNALIIGVKKGGTRALLEFIRLHPDVKAAGTEVHFFDKFYDKGLDWYRSQLPPTSKDQLTMEKTPGYFPSPDVPKRVYKMNKNIKLIVVFRNPVTRIISDFTQSVAKGQQSPIEKLALVKYKDIINTEWNPVKISMYSEHLKNWLLYFPLEQFLFLNGEKLVHDPAAEMIKVQKFLGLDVVIDQNYFYFNESKGFPCLMKKTTKQIPKCLGATKGRVHQKVDPHLIQILERFFQPYNERLYQMTGINFHWREQTPAKL